MFQKSTIVLSVVLATLSHRSVRLAALLFVCFSSITACTMSLTPAQGTWVAPARFSEEKIYSAFVPAATTNGYQPTYSDQKNGTVSFNRSMPPNGLLTLTAVVSEVENNTNVSVTCKYNSLAIAGINEEQVDRFFNALFDQLGLTDTTERYVSMVVK